MKKVHLLSILTLMIASLACGSIVPGSNPQPTDISARPSETLTPTDTPVPTDTPTPSPTATPDFAATEAYVATQTSSEVLEELERLLGASEVPYREGQLLWRQTEPVSIEMTGPQVAGNFHELDEDLVAENFIFKSEVTWDATGILICGAVFRSEPNIDTGKQYQFYFYRLSGLPAYFIDVFDKGERKDSITDTRFSSDLDLNNGGTNEFMLVAQDDQFNVYINGIRQSRYFDYGKQRSEGHFAFLAWLQSGKGSCEFENSWVWSLE